MICPFLEDYAGGKSCRDCPEYYKTDCSRDTYFLDSSLFLRVILQEKNACDVETYINNLKIGNICFISHLVIGEIFQKILKEVDVMELKHGTQQAKDKFNEIWALSGITII